MRAVPPEPTPTDPVQPTIGGYMRHQRVRLALTQQQVADRLYMSKSAYQKYENDERNPTVRAIRDWCDALELSYEKRRKVLSIVMGELMPLAVGSPESITADDVDFIDSLPYPAWLHRVPQYDILAANRAGIELCPFLDPALATGDQPVNVIVQMFTDPRAERILGNWDPIVHRLAYLLKEMSTGVVRDAEVAAIVEASRDHPRFDFMWNNPMSPEEFDDDHVVTVDSRGHEAHWRMRSLQSMHPWCDYEIFLLTPRVGGVRD